MQSLLDWLQPRIFAPRARRVWGMLLALLTALLLGQAALIGPDSGLAKNLPIGHPSMQVFREYQSEFGGANIVLVALVNKDGSPIYTDRFLAALKQASEDVNFVPCIDRARLSSLFTRNVRYVEVVDGGFVAGDVIPADYAPSPEMFARIAENVVKAGLSGRLVTLQQDGAMVVAEVIEREPGSGNPIDLVAVAESLEAIRGRFEQPEKTLYRLREASPPFEAGEVVKQSFAPSSWREVLHPVRASKAGPDGSTVQRHFWPWQLQAETIANLDYDPNLSVHILGFAKLVGDVSAAVVQVAAFFLLTVLGTGLALAWYLGSARLALLPLACSLVAVIWEFGLLKTLGYGLDPFAILVPFLVLAVSTSHGVQYVNTWADQVVQGQPALDASISTFRRLFIPGTIALITNVAGFATIYLVPIPAVREMAINACLGMAAVIVTNKLMMPLLLARLSVSDLQGFRARRLRQTDAGQKLWHWLSGVTTRGPALAVISLSVVVLLASLYWQQHRIIGDAQAGVPELRPDARYNRDVAAIARGFELGTDVLKIIAETPPDSCVDYQTLAQVDDFTWRMRNVPGVIDATSMPLLARKIHAGFWENTPRFSVLPRNRDTLVLSTRGIESITGLLNFECTALPVIVYASDHKAETIARLIAAAERLEAENAAAFYRDHPKADAEACKARVAQRRERGAVVLERQAALDRLLAQGFSELAAREHAEVTRFDAELARLQATPYGGADCPVHFALATGNLGVMAATNAAVEHAEWPALLSVYAVILLLILVSYRSWRGWVMIGLPLVLVSCLANALMALFGIGLKVATLPVVTLAVGIGVDYGIYIYDVLQHRLAEGGKSLRQAYLETLQQTGKAVIFTGLCLAGGVAAWLFSDLQFQRDMGLLLVFMFSANMLGAVLLGPALGWLVLRRPRS
ncbi:MAG: MMPL family transporter [Pseudomonadota bacterium]